MNRKILIISLIICVILLVPFLVYANKKELLYDKNSKPIIESGTDEINEIEEGTEYTLEIPINKVEKTEQDMIDEKNSFINEINSVEFYSIDNYNNEDIKQDIDIYFEEGREKGERATNIIKKYYGDDETDRLFTKIKEETNSNISEYKFPENGKKLLEVVLDIIHFEKITSAEKEDLKYLVQSMDLSTLDNQELVNKIKKL